jgi:SAM-dependent methyltransferase
MAELFRQDPLGRFTGRADDYDRYRPTYPQEAIDFIIAHAGLDGRSLLVDVGSGTGIAARLFAARAIQVIGIEPNDAMRERAERASVPAGCPAPTYRAGRAEATGLPGGVARAVLAAQAFHWFHPSNALAEFHRLLIPGGWVFLMGYERDESDPCTAAYGDVIRSAPNAAEMEQGRQASGALVGVSPFFTDFQQRTFLHQQGGLDREGLLGRALSVSYAPQDAAGIEAWRRALGDVFDRFQHQGELVLRYQTPLYVARRRE